MSEIEKSFTFLHDNIPSWLNQLGDIEEKVARMQSEIAKVPVSRSFPIKKRTGSVESIRDLEAINEEDTPSPAVQSTPTAARKRKTPSVLSGNQSGPTKFGRSRMMIIVSYDGQIQQSFEQLVRSIGTGRNMLRKGKMQARMDALSKLAASDDCDEADSADVMAKIGYRRRAGLSTIRARGLMEDRNGANDNGSSPAMFDATDKLLELAQSLCEKAAHQSLRDGDCKKQLEGVRKHFEEVLETAKMEVEKNAARKVREAVEAAKQPPVIPEPQSSSASSIDVDMDLAPRTVVSEILPTPGIAPTTSMVVDIEIDDEDSEEDMKFVMPPIRLTSRT